MSNVEIVSTGVAHDSDDVVVGNAVGGVILLQANEHRKSALIVNTGSAPMRVTTDGSNPTATHGKPIQAQGALSLSWPYCPTVAVRAIREGGTDTTANASEVD